MFYFGIYSHTRITFREHMKSVSRMKRLSFTKIFVFIHFFFVLSFSYIHSVGVLFTYAHSCNFYDVYLTCDSSQKKCAETRLNSYTHQIRYNVYSLYARAHAQCIRPVKFYKKAPVALFGILSFLG